MSSFPDFMKLVTISVPDCFGVGIGHSDLGLGAGIGRSDVGLGVGIGCSDLVLGVGISRNKLINSAFLNLE